MMKNRCKPAAVLCVCLMAILAPACGNKTVFNNEIVISIPTIDKEYDYALINDTHFFIGDDEIIEEHNPLVVNRINEFSLNGKTSAQNFDLWISNLDNRSLCGLILNADIIDQLSYANLNHVKNVLNNTKVPYMYLQSDHDLATDWTSPDEEDYENIRKIQESLDLNKGMYTFEEDGFIILGINYSWMSISQETLEAIKKEFSKGKPIIIISHVPYDSLVSEDLRNLSKEVKNDRVLLWGTRGDNYYYPNEYMQEYLNMVTSDDSPVVAVVGAHLHRSFETDMTENIKEYITGTSYSGVLTKIRIVPTQN